MVKLKPGDSVYCKINDNKIISVYDNAWQDKLIFDIISVYSEGYIIYIPDTVYIKDCITFTSNNIKNFGVNKKFINSSGYYITEYNIMGTHKILDGLCCLKCEEFCFMAQPNQSDTISFICWKCTKYPFFR